MIKIWIFGGSYPHPPKEKEREREIGSNKRN